MTTTPNAIVVNGVYKKFGKPGDPPWERALKLRKNGHAPANGSGHTNGHKRETIAVNHVSFEVREGEIFGVLGPNGSGKSTLIRLMATLLLPDEGQLQVFGYDVVRNPLDVQRIINRVSVEAGFFKKLSPTENLMYGARLYGMPGGETKKQVVEILTRLGLEKRSIYAPMEEMSREMQQKVAIARALLSKPRVLLLDEPTNHLNLPAQEVLQELLQNFPGTILLVSHNRFLIDRLATQIWELRGGRLHTFRGTYRRFVLARAEINESNRRIHEHEQALRKLNKALQKATGQPYKKIQDLSWQYAQAQTEMENLMAEWEKLAV